MIFFRLGAAYSRGDLFGPGAYSKIYGIDEENALYENIALYNVQCTMYAVFVQISSRALILF